MPCKSCDLLLGEDVHYMQKTGVFFHYSNCMIDLKLLVIISSHFNYAVI